MICGIFYVSKWKCTKLPTREQQKILLYMLISKITINKTRDIESIELNINDNLIWKQQFV